MPDINGVLAAASKLCEPTKKESDKISSVADLAIKLVQNQIDKLPKGIVVGVEFGGSFAKGTWLRGGADVDIFVKLYNSVSEEKFEELGKAIGLGALEKYRPILRYSDHPYVEAIIEDIRVNVVPCYSVESGKWKSAADRSIFHTRYINERYDHDMRGQARLLKRFLKTVGIYGAEISTAGFSGYVCEVLTLKYRSFVEVLKAASVLKERQVIAIQGYDEDIVKGFPGSLVIIDPVDPRRNLGTAISPESTAKFILAARAFLASPSLEFFAGKPPGGAPARQLYPFILIVEFQHKYSPPDVVWGQLKRATNAIAKQLEIANFVVLRAECITDEKSSAAFVFLLESMTLSRYTKRKGPEVFRAADSTKFIEMTRRRTESKSRLTWADKDMRIAVLTERRITSAKQFVKALLHSPDSSGIPKGLIQERGVQIYSGDERKTLNLLVRKAVQGLAATEKLIFCSE